MKIERNNSAHSPGEKFRSSEVDETFPALVCSLVIPKAFPLQDLFTHRNVSDHTNNINMVDISIACSMPGPLALYKQ